MSDIVIRTENLSKLYRIGEYQGGYRTLRETIVNTFSAPFRHLSRNPQTSTLKPPSDCIWALKDVSFEVKRGEVVGIIGRNGAGKSTLLRILSRITEPTEGWAEIQGRVGSLLEVGTGFHHELTGRENIYLNGAILGMKKEEIDRKFDEVVAFAEIEKFIDTPVKRYSSGMRMRLAFAVAAHLEPEILLVDEVLAVGDAAFQKKCLGKIGDVARVGRTVLFVSHNMSAIDHLCNRGVLLNEGKVEYEGLTRETIQRYLSHPEQITGFWQAESKCKNDSLPISLVEAYIATESGHKCSIVGYDKLFVLTIIYRVRRCIRNWSLTFRIVDSSGLVVFASSDTDCRFDENRRHEPNLYRATCIIPKQLLRPGLYSLTIATHVPRVKVMEFVENALYFEVSSNGYFLKERKVGVITPMLKWTTEIMCEQ